MQLDTFPLSLKLAHPFTISRGTMQQQSTLIVRLQAEGISGWGEVTQNRYYNRTVEALNLAVRKATPLLEKLQNERPESVWPELMELLDQDSFAASAIDIAAHDWHARRLGVPTWRMWGLHWERVPCSSYTIAIDSPQRMLEKLLEQPNWPIYKIKLGTEHDIEIVRTLREHTNAVFRVDANCGWSAEKTIELSQQLEALGVEFIEQPLPRESKPDEHRRVFEHSRLPIIADESCQTWEDVQRCVGLFHGVNVKICKCGGLSPALSMLRLARSFGLKTMVGCMVESAIGISAAAQLAPLLDYADLDGSALLADDPCEGVMVVDGRIRLTDLCGHGANLPVGFRG